MKLVTFGAENQHHVGAVDKGKVMDLNKVLDQPDLTMLQLVEMGLDQIKNIEQKITGEELPDECVFDLDEVTLKAPLDNPGKVVCVGNNYMDHCREQNIEPPKSPLIFSKWASCIVGPGEDILLPKESKQVDYEGELGVVFQKEGRRILKESALDHIFGYVIVHDVSARDVQFADGQWVRGKSYDTFAPCGPYLVTADEIPEPQNLSIKTIINGKTLQDSNTKEMIFDIPYLISYLSEGFAFQAGDLLATGTPHGVGVFRDPQIFLEDGDKVVIEIEGLGRLVNRCVRERE